MVLLGTCMHACLRLDFQTVRFYDVATNEQKSKYDHRAAVLACCFSDDKHGYSGGLDTSVREYVPTNMLMSLPRLMSHAHIGWTCRLSRSITWANTPTQSHV